MGGWCLLPSSRETGGHDEPSEKQGGHNPYGQPPCVANTTRPPASGRTENRNTVPPLAGGHDERSEEQGGHNPPHRTPLHRRCAPLSSPLKGGWCLLRPPRGDGVLVTGATPPTNASAEEGLPDAVEHRGGARSRELGEYLDGVIWWEITNDHVMGPTSPPVDVDIRRR